MKPVQNSGTLPLLVEAVLSVSIGCVSARSTKLQRPLDSYQVCVTQFCTHIHTCQSLLNNCGNIKRLIMYIITHLNRILFGERTAHFMPVQYIMQIQLKYV